MRAIHFREFGGPEKLQSGTFPDPVPGPDEVTVRVRACGVNRLDVWVIKGIPAYKITPPHAPGSDIAGTVEQVGTGVAGWKAGDPVVLYPVLSCGTCVECTEGKENLCASRSVIGAGAMWGGYAELIRVPASSLLQKPSTLSFEQAAAIPITFITAWHMLNGLAGLKAGQTVLVMGAGSGVGVAAIVIAKHLGARVLAAATTESRRARAITMGAEVAFDSTHPDFWKAVRDATGGRGVEVVFEHIGPAVFKAALQSLAPGGTLVTCGATTGPEVTVDLRYVFSRQLSIKGCYIGPRRELEGLLRLFELGKLAVTLDSTIPVERAGEAMTRLLTGSAFGKIVLTHSS